MKENVYLLITAIILQAEKDYFSSIDKLRYSAVDFFQSGDFEYLTGIDGNVILKRLENGEIGKPKDVLDAVHRRYDPIKRNYRDPW